VRGQCVALDAGLISPLDGSQENGDGGDHDLSPGNDGPPIPASCTNKMQDGDETDIDCGGQVCPKCPDLNMCVLARDCVSSKCASMHCQPPTCHDGVQNGSETDMDCGGSCPTACDIGQHCKVPSDCLLMACAAGTCVMPSCMDQQLNGSETDVDCGGGACPPCLNNKSCVNSNDCWSQHCNASQKCAGCPNDMVQAPSGTCIDFAEVSNMSYYNFISANVSVNMQPSYCQWNATFTPSSAWPYTIGENDFPIRYVDWCDALAYCTWMSRRLCSSVAANMSGPVGHGAVEFTTDFKDESKDEWMNACDDANASQAYPYGSSYSSTACNGANTTGSLASSDDQHTCVGGVTGLYHMSGNVEEWENSCDGTTGMTDNCHARGGNYQSDVTALRCDGQGAYPRSTTAITLGFRCCGG
jgi:hypothetical protein